MTSSTTPFISLLCTFSFCLSVRITAGDQASLPGDLKKSSFKIFPQNMILLASLIVICCNYHVSLTSYNLLLNRLLLTLCLLLICILISACALYTPTNQLPAHPYFVPLFLLPHLSLSHSHSMCLTLPFSPVVITRGRL